ncbi:hypothetical protein M0813_08825 [Anaeramoeba flamelloides]|uniref:Uncharacterized protein n=1 Tax=Anaeramoeba flamelloides TaxID=1746091 RepID=A0ABQ8X7G5_9EUKA|nr:hypothetical protein M0813_08825 [Anaeramoeba flamelloides]
MEFIQPLPKSPTTLDFYGLYYAFANYLYSIYSDNDDIDPIQALMKFKNTLPQSFLSQQMDYQFGLIIQIFIQTGLLSNENTETNKPETLQLSPSWRSIINHITKSVRGYNKAGKKYVPKKEEIQIGDNRQCRTISMLGQLVLNELRNGADSREKISEKTGFARQRICTVLSVFKAIGVVKEFGTRRKLKIQLNQVQERFLPLCLPHLHELNMLKNEKREMAKETFELLEKLKEKRKVLKRNKQIFKYKEMIKKIVGNLDANDPNFNKNHILDPNSKFLPQLKQPSEFDRIKNKRNLDQTDTNIFPSNHKHSVKPRKVYFIRTKKKKYKLFVGYNSNKKKNNNDDFDNQNYYFSHFNYNTLAQNPTAKNFSNKNINNYNNEKSINNIKNINCKNQPFIPKNQNIKISESMKEKFLKNQPNIKMQNCNYNNNANLNYNFNNEMIPSNPSNFKKQENTSQKIEKNEIGSSNLNFNKDNENKNNNNNQFNKKKTTNGVMNYLKLPKPTNKNDNENENNNSKINLWGVSENKLDDFLKTVLENFPEITKHIQNNQGENNVKKEEITKIIPHYSTNFINSLTSPSYNISPSILRVMNSNTSSNLALNSPFSISPIAYQSISPFRFMDSPSPFSPFTNMKMRVPPNVSPYYYESPPPLFSNPNFNNNSKFSSQPTTSTNNHPSSSLSSDQNKSELLLQTQNQGILSSQQNPILENPNQPITIPKLKEDHLAQPQIKTPIFQKRDVLGLKKFFGFGFK